MRTQVFTNVKKIKNEVVCTEGKVCVHVGKKNEASKTNMNML